jgi:lysophospholipid acyltransferase (LPLAT)-like uncharacterized protein
VPVAYHLNWKIRLHSWDGFQVPLPGARCEAEFGPTTRVFRTATEADRETLRQQLEKAMLAITKD